MLFQEKDKVIASIGGAKMGNNKKPLKRGACLKR